MIPIVYGYPLPETEDAAERGELVIYGCLIGAADPQHVCRSCDVAFNFKRPDLLDAEDARRKWSR